jgi:hypothetical protein
MITVKTQFVMKASCSFVRNFRTYGMAIHRVADRKGGLQIWRAAGDILTDDKWWPSGLVVGRGANNSSTVKKKKLLRNVTQDLGMVR